jgi:hypothetical protein
MRSTGWHSRSLLRLGSDVVTGVDRMFSRMRRSHRLFVAASLAATALLFGIDETSAGPSAGVTPRKGAAVEAFVVSPADAASVVSPRSTRKPYREKPLPRAGAGGASKGLPLSAYFAQPSSQPTLTFETAGVDIDPLPEPAIAVSANHVVVASNRGFWAHTRTGQLVRQNSWAQFFAPVIPPPSEVGGILIFDPRALYDAETARFVVVLAYRDIAPQGVTYRQSAVLVAVSASSDPAGNWIVRKFRNDEGSTYEVDFPVVGSSSTGIAVSAWLLSKTNGVQNKNRVLAFNRAELFSTATISGTQFDVAQINSFIAGVERRNDADGRILFLRRDPSSFNRVLVSWVAADFSTFQSNVASFEWPIKQGSRFSPLDNHQAGSSIKPTCSAGLSSMTNGGSLYVADTIFLDDGPVVRSAMRWAKVRTSGWVVADGGVLHGLDTDRIFQCGSIAANDRGDVLIGASTHDGTSYVSSAYALRLGSDCPRRLRKPAIYRAGERAVNYGTRMGDYSSTVLDPDGLTFWTAQLVARTGTNPTFGSYGVQVAALGPDPSEPPCAQRVLPIILDGDD